MEGKANTILGDIVFLDALEVLLWSMFALSSNFVTMDVRGSRDLEGARVAVDADPRGIRILGVPRWREVTGLKQ